MKKINIILADDHKILRDSLRMLLNQEYDFSVVGEAKNGFELDEIVKSTDADILLLDISMPKKNGFEVAKVISKEAKSPSIIFLTMHKNDKMLSEAFESGARGYVLKENAFEELATAIREVNSGKIFVSPELASLMLPGFLENHRNQIELSDRELEVIKLLAEGYSNKEIADILSISIKTVETHRANIMRKHGFKNITELVLFAVRNKIIEI